MIFIIVSEEELLDMAVINSVFGAIKIFLAFRFKTY